MSGDLAEPVDAAVFQGGGGGEAFGDGLGDDRLLLFGQPRQQCSLAGNQTINLCRLLIQKSGNALLGFEGGHRTADAPDHFQIQPVTAILTGEVANMAILAGQPPVEKFAIDCVWHNGCERLVARGFDVEIADHCLGLALSRQCHDQ